MASTECIHGLDPAWCSLCKAPEKKREEKRERAWRWGDVPTGAPISAQFAGPCASECGQRIEEGDIIVYSDEHGGWIHADDAD
jgi:hypothetical protein